MQETGETRSANTRSTSDRKVIRLGMASLVVALASYAFAWYGGLWATPVWMTLAVATWRRAWQRRHGHSTKWFGAKAGAVIAGVAFLVGVYGFASSGGLGPALRADSATYAPGDVVGVRLKAGIRPVGFNMCPLFFTLERRGAEGWERLDANPDPDEGVITVCTVELTVMPPLFSAGGEVPLPPDLPSGSYRLTYRLPNLGEPEAAGERRVVATDPFAVTR